MFLKMGDRVINTDTVTYVVKDGNDLTHINFIGGSYINVPTKDTDGYFDQAPSFSEVIKYQERMAKGSPIRAAPGNVVLK